MIDEEALRAALKLKVYKDLQRIWRVSTIASDDRVVFGRGDTAEQAIDDVINSLNIIEDNLSLSPEVQLHSICGKDSLCHDDLERAVRLLAKLVLE